MRPEVAALVELGPMPSEDDTTGDHDADVRLLQQYEELLHAIDPPVSDKEARVLVRVFPLTTSCFGAAWTLLHLAETAPSWPIRECLLTQGREWVDRPVAA